MTAKLKEIHIDDLILDVDNFRIGRVGSEEQAITKIIEEQGDKLSNLAEHICENGLSPTKLLLLFPTENESEKYLVIDGNRRVCAIKLVLKPDLALGTSAKLENKFKELHSVYASSIIKDIHCCVETDLEKAKEWRRIEHYMDGTGIGQQKWSNSAKARADEEDDSIRNELIILDFALAGNFLAEDTKQIARSNKFKLSTLERIINSPHVRKVLGIHIEAKGLFSESSPRWLIEAVSKIITVIVDKKFDGSPFSVRKVNTSEQMKDFIKKIVNDLEQSNDTVSRWEVNKSNAPTDKPKSDPNPGPNPNPGPGPGPGPGPVPKPKPPQQRVSIIPDEYPWREFKNNKKLSYIFRELKTLDAKKYPFSAAFSFRALLEMSLALYCKSKLKEANKSDIETRANLVLEHMVRNNKINNRNSSLIESRLKDKPISIVVELHSYVHNLNFHADGATLIARWDDLENFFKALWEDLD